MRATHRLLTVLAIGVPLIFGGCILPDQLADVQKELADVQQELKKAQLEQAETQEKLEQLERSSRDGGSEVSREDMAEMMLRIDQFSREMSITEERINDLNQRLDRYSHELQQTRELARRGATAAAVPNPVDGTDADATALGTEARDGGTTTVRGMPPPPGAGGQTTDAMPDPEALYNTSYADFSKGNYALAISGFEEYYERFPDSAFADNALYWIAECHFSQGNFRAAIDAFDRLLDSHPQSDKAPAGNLKKALAYLEQNQVGQAIVQLRYVTTSYPDTDESRLARDKLASLGASTE